MTTEMRKHLHQSARQRKITKGGFISHGPFALTQHTDLLKLGYTPTIRRRRLSDRLWHSYNA